MRYAGSVNVGEGVRVDVGEMQAISGGASNVCDPIAARGRGRIADFKPKYEDRLLHDTCRMC